MSDKIITLENLKDFRNNLSDVAVSGDYYDLENHPIPATDLEIRRMFETEYSITTLVTNGYVVEGSDTTIWSKETASVIVAANSEYYLPESISVTGAQYNYDNKTGMIALSNAIGNVEISVVCESEQPQPTGLTPFEVGDTPTEYGVDTGAKTTQEMNEWLASLTYYEYFSYLVTSTPQGAEAYSFTIYAVHKDSLYVLLALANYTDGDAGTLLYANESHQADDFIPIDFDAGWQVQNGVRPIDNDMLGTISMISDEFATINGVIIGAIQDIPPIPTGLNPFYDGTDGEHPATTFSQFVVNPNALTQQQLEDYIASLPKDDSQVQGKVAIGGIITTNGQGGSSRLNIQGDTANGYFIEASHLTGHDPNVLWYSNSKAQTYGFPQGGWFTTQMGDETGATIQALDEETTFQCYTTLTTTSVSEYFAPLNGTVFGAVLDNSNE